MSAMTTIKTSIRLFIAAIFLPLAFSGMMYIGSTTAYTWGVFDEAGFHQQYSDGIYKYRVLGRESLVYFQGLIEKGVLGGFSPGVFKADLNVQSAWYAAHFYNNSLYLCLACCLLFFIFEGHRNNRYSQVELPLLGMSLLMTLTQYVVVPYDTLSYLFLLLGVLLSFTLPQSLFTVFLLAVTVAVATLNRETSFLIISFYVAVNYKSVLLHNPLKGLSKQQWAVLLLCLAFFSAYLSLRFYYGFQQALYHDVQIFQSFRIFAILGLLFMFLLLINVFLTAPVSAEMKAFMLTSAPYSIMIILVAMPNEMRLWIPILLPLLILKLAADKDVDDAENKKTLESAMLNSK